MAESERYLGCPDCRGPVQVTVWVDARTGEPVWPVWAERLITHGSAECVLDPGAEGGAYCPACALDCAAVVVEAT